MLTFLKHFYNANIILFNTEKFYTREIVNKSFKILIRKISFKLIYGFNFKLVESNKKLIEYLDSNTLRKYKVKEFDLNAKNLHIKKSITEKKIVILNQPFFEKGRVDKNHYFNFLDLLCCELQTYKNLFNIYFKEHPNTKRYFYKNDSIKRFPSFIPSEYLSLNKHDILITYSSTSVFNSNSKIISLIDILQKNDVSAIRNIKLNLLSKSVADIYFPKKINELLKMINIWAKK
jgi:hypothetical protein